MRIDFKMDGFDDLQRRLDQLPSAVSRNVQIAALKKGAEPIRSMASTLAPRDEEAGAPHLADNIIVAVPRKSEAEAEGVFDGAVVAVGPAAPFFYGFFQEVGTAFHGAQAFMRPAFDSQVRRAQNIIRADLWAAIRKRLNIGGGVSTGGRGL